jgi:CRP-like cAMP-binding protein
MERAYRKIDITPDALLACHFFDHLERAERARIACYCDGRVYRPGYEIVRHRDTSTDVYFILNGRVEATILTWAGKVVSLQPLARGDMFGELSALDAGPRTTGVVTEAETTVLRISGPNFKDLVARNASLAERVMLRLCELSRHLCEKAFEARAYPVPVQIMLEIHREVRRLAHAAGPLVVDPAPTHKEIAERVGTTREQVTRVMTCLGRTGHLLQTGRRWEIADVDALLRHIEGKRPG